jgi:hypothetical protein
MKNNFIIFDPKRPLETRYIERRDENAQMERPFM